MTKSANKKILQAFLTEKLKDYQVELSEKIFDTLFQGIEMKISDPDETLETRDIKIKKDSDGNYTAESFKAYNIAEINLQQIFKLARDLFPLAAFPGAPIEAVIFSVFCILSDFFPDALTREFKALDARLIYTSDHLELFDKEMLMVKYNELFPEKPIETTDLDESLAVLLKAKVIAHSTEIGKLTLVEDIVNIERH